MYFPCSFDPHTFAGFKYAETGDCGMHSFQDDKQSHDIRMDLRPDTKLAHIWDLLADTI